MATKAKIVGYIPTVDGRPAKMDSEGHQLCICNRLRATAPLPSIRAVRRQIASTVKWRIAQGFHADPGEYGYVRVEIPR
jgi:hypothetical protein